MQHEFPQPMHIGHSLVAHPLKRHTSTASHSISQPNCFNMPHHPSSAKAFSQCCSTEYKYVFRIMGSAAKSSPYSPEQGRSSLHFLYRRHSMRQSRSLYAAVVGLYECQTVEAWDHRLSKMARTSARAIPVGRGKFSV